MEHKGQIEEDIQTNITDMYHLSSDLVELGAQEQRIDFFDALQELIQEKEFDGEDDAVSVLSWAYDQLQEMI